MGWNKWWVYNIGSQIKFKSSMLRSSLCDYRDAYVLVNCISKISNKEKDNAKDIVVVMPMYNLTEYSDNYIRKHQEVYSNTIEMNHL